MKFTWNDGRSTKLTKPIFDFRKKKELMQSSKTTKKRINAIFKNKTKRINAIFKNEKKCFSKDTGILSKTRRLVQYPKISLPPLYNPSETGWHIITSQWRGNLYLRYCVGISKHSQRVYSHIWCKGWHLRHIEANISL